LNNQAVVRFPSANQQSVLRERTKGFCVAAVVAILIATLWPFNPSPRNGVAWLQRTAGLKFEGAGVVVSSEPLKPAETQPSGAYTLELMLRPATTKAKSTVMAFYTPTRPRQLLVRQYKDSLEVTHDSAVEYDRAKTVNFAVDHFFRPGKLALVTISSGSNGTAVYLDGQFAESFPRFKISPSELSGQIVLGTSAVNYAPWEGELRGLAIYSKEMTPGDALRHYKEWTDPSGPADLEGAMARYTFAEGSGREVGNQVAGGPQLAIPASFSVPHKDFLRSARKEFRTNWRYAKDVLENIAGFVPLGLIVCAYVASTRNRWEAILITIMACGTLSFVIEVLQYYIPRRGSGTTDIITNTLGAALGATLTHARVGRHVLERMKLIRTVDQ
jgi:VanZ family protein